mgnify:CR=1 FL=1
MICALCNRPADTVVYGTPYCARCVPVKVADPDPKMADPDPVIHRLDPEIFALAYDLQSNKDSYFQTTPLTLLDS